MYRELKVKFFVTLDGGIFDLKVSRCLTKPRLRVGLVCHFIGYQDSSFLSSISRNHPLNCKKIDIETDCVNNTIIAAVNFSRGLNFRSFRGSWCLNVKIAPSKFYHVAWLQ